MRTRSWQVLAVLAAGAMLAGCQTGPGDEAVIIDESESIDSVETETIELDADLWPLTGLARGDADASLPALGAKIDNASQARPQVGLDEADIVFEELVEGGLTRYLAVWHSSLPAEIGPVRSVRPMDPDIISPFGGILAYSGGQQRFIEAMLDAPVASAINGQSDVRDFFYRTGNNVAPHNVIVLAPELQAYFADRGGPPPQFNFATSADESSAARSGSDAASLRVAFSGVSAPTWTWSDTDGVFVRSQTNGAPDTAISGEQLSADNVVVIEVDIQVIQDIPTTQMVGSGEGLVATAGKALEISWSKASAESPIELTDGSGARVLLAPGQTWVELIPASGSGVPAGSVDIQ